MNHALATTERPLRAVARVEPVSTRPADTVDEYLENLLHDWLKTLSTLGFTLIPIFFVLDVFMMPRELLPRFALYRLVTTAIIIAQHFLIRFTRPTPRSYLHGYFLSVVAGFMITLMTTDLGGFNSTYYAGLNLVMIAVNLLLPWSASQSAINSFLIIGPYIILNALVPHERVHSEILVNNLYFLCSTGVISTSINYVKQKLIVQEFHLRADLKKARDALWGEMEVAKRIQTSLLPKLHEVNGYLIAASMRAAAQKPSEVLTAANTVLKTNISRMGADRYVTCMAMRLDPESVTFAGKHQDVLVYRARTGTTEQISTEGVWLGVVDDVTEQFPDVTLPIEEGDVLLLYTDG